MVTNACTFLTNSCEFLTKLTITFQSICRISCESFANVKNTYECPYNFANACERLTNETTTQRMRGETPCQCFAVSLLFARLY